MQKLKKGIVLPFLLLISSVILILGAFFILDNNQKTNTKNPTQTVSPSPTDETVNTDATENAEWITLKSFIDSKGNTKYLLLEITFNPLTYKSYLSTTENKNDHIIFIKDIGVGGGLEGAQVQVSRNTGTKYLLFPDGTVDGGNFILIDENGKEIKVDIENSDLTTKTKSHGGYGVSFYQNVGGWIGKTTNFTIQVQISTPLPDHKFDDTTYEAIFDATTGKQIGETKQVK